MKRFKRLGVFLHNSPADETALAFVARIAEMAGSEAVYCVHVHEPDSTADDPSVEALRARVLAALPKPVADVTRVEVHAANAVPEILRTARDQALDMVIVGRRLPSDQLGIGASFARLARKCPCDVLVVPLYARPHLERVLVATDFSAHSRLALEHALAFLRACGGDRPQLVVHSNFSVGYGYSKLGVTLAQAVADRAANVEKQLHTLVAGIDTAGLAVETVATSGDRPEAAIQELAAVRKMDFIVLGSRGQSAATLLGSVAERVLCAAVVPVLVVKPKGETNSILNLLLGSA